MDENKANNGGEGNGAPDTKNTTTNQSGTDPTKTVTGQAETFDPTKLSDEQFAKVFEDKRVWTHDRFKQLNEKAKKADAFEKQQAEEADKKLLEEKKYQELLAKKDEEIKTLQVQHQTAVIDNLILAEAQKKGVIDTEAVLKLIDRNGITTGNDGQILGVIEAVAKLVETKAYLLNKPGQPSVGSGTNPSGANQSLPKFKASQLTDVAFYRAHEKEIDQAMRLGLIENDLPQ